MSKDRVADYMSNKWILRLHTKCSNWNRSLFFFHAKVYHAKMCHAKVHLTSKCATPKCATPKCAAPKCSTPKCHSRQSAPHAKVSFYAHMSKWYSCQCGIMSKLHSRQSGHTPKCSRQSVPRQSILRQNVCQPFDKYVLKVLVSEDYLHFQDGKNCLTIWSNCSDQWLCQSRTMTSLQKSVSMPKASRMPRS